MNVAAVQEANSGYFGKKTHVDYHCCLESKWTAKPYGHLDDTMRAVWRQAVFFRLFYCIFMLEFLGKIVRFFFPCMKLMS